MLDFADSRLLEAVLDSLDSGVYLVDKHRKIAYWNHGAERISGYLRQDVTGRFCRDDILVHTDENDRVLCGHACPLADCMRDGQPREAQVYLLHRAGHRVPVHVRSVPLRNSFGDIVGAAEIFEARAFEPEMDNRQNELARHGCVDPTTELPNRALMVSYLREQLALFAEHRLSFSMLLVEPDHLEQFVATHGREAGRSILQVLAHTLKSALRPTDFLGRWNNTQFLAILCGCREDTLPSMAHRLQAVVHGSAIQ
jgi:PAS domain S-box-containing protein